MGKDCKDCLPCKQGLPCEGDQPKIHRITNFSGDCGLEFAALSKNMDWNKFSDAVERCSMSQDFLKHPFNQQLDTLGEQLRSGKICPRIYLNRAVAILDAGGAPITLGYVYPQLAKVRRQAILATGISVIGGSYLLKERPSKLVNTAAPAAMVFSALYLARTYNIL